jgi:hypothetical protein
MRRYLVYVFYFLGGISLALSIGWFYRDRDWEPAMAIVAAIAELLGVYCADKYLESKSAIDEEQRNQAVSKALFRIERERGNFEQLQRKIKYSSNAQRKAVEKYSFELLENDLSALLNYWAFRRLTKKILGEVTRLNQTSDKSDVSQLLSLLDQLEGKLKQSALVLRS